MRNLKKRKYRSPSVEAQNIDNEISLIMMSSYTGDGLPPVPTSTGSTIKLNSTSSGSTETTGNFDANPFVE